MRQRTASPISSVIWRSTATLEKLRIQIRIQPAEHIVPLIPRISHGRTLATDAVTEKAVLGSACADLRQFCDCRSHQPGYGVRCCTEPARINYGRSLRPRDQDGRRKLVRLP